MNFDDVFSMIGDSAKIYAGRFKGRHTLQEATDLMKTIYREDGTHNAMTHESLHADNPTWKTAINRNSAIGQTHTVLTSMADEWMSKANAPYAAGAAMGVMGIGAASFVNNEMGNHPGAAPAIGVGAGLFGFAAALDPAVARNFLKGKAAGAGEKAVSEGLASAGMSGVVTT